MKITILSNSKGGVFTATMEWARGLVSKGCDINIFFLTQSEEAKHLLPSEHIRINYFILSNFLPNFWAIISFLHDRSDIIHINFAWFGPLATLKKWLFKTPFIYTSHGLPQPWLEPSLVYRIAYTIEHCLLRFVVSQSSGVVAISNYVKEMLKERYDVDSEVIHHGIHADKFKPKNKAESKRRFGYKETNFIILFVGKLHPCKNPLILIRAIPKMVKMNPNLRVVMAGTGELYEQIRNEILRLNLSRYVKLLGLVEHEKVRLWYDAADVFVLTSVSEAFGMTLLEAMASGLPVIASKVGACPEVIGKAGILYTPGNRTDLAEKIITLSRDEKVLRRLAEAGLKRVKDKFCWKDKINQYWKLYRTKIQH